MNMWNPNRNHAGRETYHPGSNAKFKEYLRQVEDTRVRHVAERIRIRLGMNHDKQAEQAFKELEKIIQDHITGIRRIPDNSVNTLEMLARQYQAIWDRFRFGEQVTDEQYEIALQARKRAEALYTRIGKPHRAEAMTGAAQYGYWRKNEV